uniref:Transmembrane protein n=1 Tax=Mycena chlorophos TaxID=658473 RepID=A0ABQ0M5F1_MYCCL|nr:predicted protein [Mycena chlorophos]
MASSFNLTIDDASPLISYGPSGAWQDASSSDTAGLDYTAGTLHQTTTQGATATIQFNGTGIEIYGGHRPEYGTYKLTVDGQEVESSTATAPGVEVQQLLGSATGLANGPHTAVLTSTGVGMDIDWAKLITSVGTPGSTLTAKAVDDTAFTYAGNWATATGSQYANGTIHYTQSQGSAASLEFSGNAIAVYGTVSPNHANIQLSIDGQSTIINTQPSFISAMHPQTLLYYADNLDSSQHMLIVTNAGQQSGTGPFIDLDSVKVYSASGGTASEDNQATTQTVSKSSSSKGLSTGAIIGASLAVIIAVLGLLGLVLFLGVRRKRRIAAQRQAEDPPTPKDAELPLQAGNLKFTPDTPIQPMPTFTGMASRMSGHSIAPSYYAFSAPAQSFGSKSKSKSKQQPPMPQMTQVPRLGMPMPPSRSATVMGNAPGPPARGLP